jgi:hypothetical protein
MTNKVNMISANIALNKWQNVVRGKIRLQLVSVPRPFCKLILVCWAGLLSLLKDNNNRLTSHCSIMIFLSPTVNHTFITSLLQLWSLNSDKIERLRQFSLSSTKISLIKNKYIWKQIRGFILFIICCFIDLLYWMKRSDMFK